MATVNLSKVEARNRLAPRRDPYWQRIEAGCFVGLRQMPAESPGTWLAHCRDASAGKQWQHPLGEFAEHPAHARFDAASKAAREWFTRLERGGKATPITVKVACENYVKHLRSGGKEQAAQTPSNGLRGG